MAFFSVTKEIIASTFPIKNADAIEAATLQGYTFMSYLINVTEKLEGQNFSVTYAVLEDKIYVNQRNYSIQALEGDIHDFWKVANNKGVIRFVESLKEFYPNRNITVYGEFIGSSVQSNIYKLIKL